MDESPELRFGWGLKALLPILAISLFGLAAPLLDTRPRARSAAEEVEERVPYNGELREVLEDPTLLDDQRAAVEALHKELTAAMATKGGITPTDARKVALLRRRR